MSTAKHGCNGNVDQPSLVTHSVHELVSYLKAPVDKKQWLRVSASVWALILKNKEHDSEAEYIKVLAVEIFLAVHAVLDAG